MPTSLGIGMVHQHFKLVECFTVLDNIILGVEPTKAWLPAKGRGAQKGARAVAKNTACRSIRTRCIEDITVGMQQRTEILKMLYRDNEILIFDEPTAVLTPQEIDELMQIMREPARPRASRILFISHKLQRDHGRGRPLHRSAQGQVHRHGRDRKTPPPRSSRRMMVGRDVNFHVDKKPAQAGRGCSGRAST